jgi:flagellar biosynthesis protein FlhF
VLIDTAGRSPSDHHVHDVLKTLDRRRHVRTHLVLAADTSASSARRVFDRFEAAHPSRVVITKVDEAESVMPLLGVIRERGLPVSYVAGGQRVPEDLERATPEWLAAAMLSGGGQEAVTCH